MATTADPLPASITAPPTAQFTPAPGCLDAGNNWLVTTSCFVDLGHSLATPDWLTCSVTHFGAPGWNDPSCYLSTTAYDVAPSTVDGQATTSFYSGCPAGYTPALATAYPGWNEWEFDGLAFDATAYSFGCCPSLYPFTYNTETFDPHRTTTTEHNGGIYTVNLYPLPACVATPVPQLSGSEIPVRTWSNTMAWDKKLKRQDSQPTSTLSWDFEHGTLFAQAQRYGYTVFQGTHTCWEHCSTWFTYYYPGGSGGSAWPSSSSFSFSIPEGDGESPTETTDTAVATTVDQEPSITVPTPVPAPTSPPLPSSSSAAESEDTTAASASGDLETSSSSTLPDGSGSGSGSGSQLAPSTTAATSNSSSEATTASTPAPSIVSVSGAAAVLARSLSVFAGILLSAAIAITA
ncbi:hypothetical protein F4779DRAFT_584271 [Xylariaceae sp. FL0662B]|nr:hypothetical protein F4779DRAFT_584271 [Xylariaceae sp. FL0662B]